MAAKTWKVRDESATNILHFLQSILSEFHPRDFAVELWDGTRWPPEKNLFPRFTWKINHADALRAAIFSPNREVSLAEAYCRGDFDIEGDIEAVFALGDYLINKQSGTLEKLRLVPNLLALRAGRAAHAGRDGVYLRGRLHSKRRDQQAIRYHYDLSNDFYELWLDRNMEYSCAYFEQPNEDIDTAQQRKLDYICQKLRLKPGERLLDIGCGWGGLIRYAANRYGVHAVGITLSQEQRKWAEACIRKDGLEDRCEVRLLDYRDLNEPGAYDKIASIGMVEHVGEAKLAEYFHRAFSLVRPGGVFLNSGIAHPGNRPMRVGAAFTDLHIFPDGELITLSNLLQHAEAAKFVPLDLENLSEHYRLTLLQWLRRLENREAAAKAIVGEVRYRTWRLYLAGSAYYFRTGKLALYHALFLKSEDGRSVVPLTRADWYRPSSSA